MASNNGTSGTRPETKASPLHMWKANRASTQRVSWADVDPVLLHSVVDLVTAAGGAIMLGRTYDGGALSVMVLYKNEKVKEYPHSEEEATALLEQIRLDFKAS